MEWGNLHKVRGYAGCAERCPSGVGRGKRPRRKSEPYLSVSHTLKGLSGNLGLESFYQTISVLTEQLRNKNLDHLEESMRDAEDIYKMLIQKISRL